MLGLVLLAWGGCLGAGCGSPPDVQEAEAVALEDIATFRRERIEELKQPDSWLTLAGLHWLDEGETTFGSAPSNDIVFAEGKAPERIGTFTFDGQTVRMRVEPGVVLTHEGEPVDTLTLVSDAGETPTELRYGSLTWYVIERDHGVGIRLKDSEHPALAAFDGIETFPVDLALRLKGRVEWYDPPKVLQIPTIMGSISEQTAPGTLVFEIDGATYRLDVTGERGDEAFFVVFADKTNGRETYGGGRYMWVDAPDENDELIIDFNKSYNPPCVFTPYATCPLPTPQNRLPLRIEAGEKVYGKETF
ncbi:MAG: DUF1684 domain-containing protein [Rhodothermales bacterium]